MLKNISISLRATGPAAVLIVWQICFTLRALFGPGTTAALLAQGSMSAFGVFLLSALAQKVE